MNDQLRLVVMGQQAFGKDVLDKILQQGRDDVLAVYCEPDRDGKPVDPLKELALERNIPVYQPKDFNGQADISQLSALNADLMIMAFVNVFVPEAARNAPKMGSICFHPSLLPLHRGPSAVNWPIIMGSTTSGYSWFYPTDGLDEGDVLFSWECPIAPDDTVVDLYFKKIYPSAVESVLKVTDLFRSGEPPRIIQDESKATYERRCTKRHTRIDWNKPVAQVYNLIRGANPSPGAWTTYDGKEVQIFDCIRIEGDGLSSKVMETTKDGVVVQCIGGRILIKRVRPAGEGKITAAEWGNAVNISKGDELNT